MKPRPAFQQRQAHKQRKALGRALHHIRMNRDRFHEARRIAGRIMVRVPRIVQKHRRLLLRTLYRGG